MGMIYRDAREILRNINMERDVPLPPFLDEGNGVTDAERCLGSVLVRISHTKHFPRHCLTFCQCVFVQPGEAKLSTSNASSYFLASQKQHW
jgi:hypothetical protein